MAPTEHNPNTTPTPRGGGTTGLAIIVGILVVVVAVLAWFVLGGDDVDTAGTSDDVTITIEGAGEAGNAIGEAATQFSDTVDEAINE